MDPKASHTKQTDVECLDEQNQEPQVMTMRKVGAIRGFFIMTAALSLTIFIGLGAVVVINDINDNPRRLGYYGHLSEIAQHECCRFHVKSFYWLRPTCQDQNLVEKFRNFEPGDWFTDADLKEALDEPCDMEIVLAE